MKKSHWVHLSFEGKQQMTVLSQIIHRSGISPNVIWTSLSSRAKESAKILSQTLEILNIVEQKSLDNVDCPVPYQTRMTMEELERRGGDVYDLCDEKPEQVADRISQVF